MSEIIKGDAEVLVKPGTDIVASMANDFKVELQDIVDDTDGNITLDLSGVEMVDSVGIGVIIATHNSLNKRGRHLKVINIAREIFNLFRTMRLDKHFTVECAE